MRSVALLPCGIVVNESLNIIYFLPSWMGWPWLGSKVDPAGYRKSEGYKID